MQRHLPIQEQLVPLRRFSSNDLYAPAYLSHLVQRKKLKAKKIGRNFFTTQKWFEEYLQKHAKDEIREAYEIFFTEIDKARKKQKLNKQLIKYKNGNTTSFGGSFMLLKNAFSARVIATILAFIVVLLLISQFSLMQDKGRIAGKEEKAEEVKTEFNNGAVRFGE